MNEEQGASERHSLLIVEDDEALRRQLVRAFRSRGWEVREAESLAMATQLAEEESPEFALVDLRLPEASGLEVIHALRSIDPSTRIFVLTGYGSINSTVTAMRLGASGYLTKPADVDDILAAFAEAESAPLTVSSPMHDAPSLARVEWEHINRVLGESGGNVSEAARRLRVHRRSLQRKLQRFAPR